MSEEEIKPKRKPRAKKEAVVVETPTVPADATLGKPEPINWREFIPEEHIEIQTNWYLKNGINPTTLSAEEKNELKARAGDENLVIKLAGFKYLAHLAGIQSVSYRLLNWAADHVAVQCELIFGKQVFSGLANASKENTNYPFNMFLESMAENRAFCRACRMAFNINILGAEEMNPTTAEFTQDTLLSDDEGCTSPQESLRILLDGKTKTFADLKQSLIKKEWAGVEDWHDYKDIPSDQCLLIIATIQSKPKG